MTDISFFTTTTSVPAPPAPAWATGLIFLGVGAVVVGLWLAAQLFIQFRKKPLAIMLESDATLSQHRVNVENDRITIGPKTWILESRAGRVRPFFDMKNKVPVYFLPAWATSPLVISKEGIKATMDAETLKAKFESKLQRELSQLSLTDMLNAPNWSQIFTGVAAGLLLSLVLKKFGWL